MTQLEQRRFELRKELAAVERQIFEEQREAYLSDCASSDEARVYGRFCAGDYIINSSGRCWWVNGGNLKDMVAPSQMAALKRLIESGIIEHCSWSAIIKQ